MFETNRQHESEVNTGRRVFVAGGAAALGGVLLWSWRKPHMVVALAKSEPGEVTVVQFSDAGKRLSKVKIAKVVKTEDEWRKQLPQGVFEITRHADTEPARHRDLSLHLLRQCAFQFGDEV
jgi:peptide-methionine (R)-S-oxide reductase